MKPLFCLVCGVNIGTRYYLHGTILTAGLCTLSDGKQAYRLLEEISKTSLKPKDLEHKSFCKKCLKKCQDYYDMQINLKTLEDDILLNFKNTNITKITPITTETNKNEIIAMTKVKQEKLATPNRSLLKTFNRPINHSPVSSAASRRTEESSIGTEESFKRYVANIKKSVMTIDINSLPKGFMERFGSNKHIIIDKDDLNIDSTLGVVQQNNEITNYNYRTILVEKSSAEDQENATQDKMEAVSEDEMETEYLLDDVEILDEVGDEDDDDSETILMSDSGLLHMVKGSANKFITLLNDIEDSNEESQIEVQVSGDEATANAIIAAAQKRGCAYIKVNSDEVIRMKSPPKSEPVDCLSEDPLAVTEELQEIMTYHENKYHCQLCNNRDESAEFSTSNAKAMMDHMNTEHDSKVYICSLCQYVAKLPADYTQHMATQHESKISKSNQKKYKCSDCDKSFSTKVLLEQHVHVHKGRRPFQCDVCTKNFTSKYILQSHLKTHTKRERAYNCSICNKSFYTLNNLHSHEKIHTSARNFKCNSCDKTFLTRHNLEVHSVVHSKVKPFVCGVCDKAFARKPEIRDHMRTHTGERPFACSLCPAAFSQRSNLHSHRRNTHTQEKRYACELCDKRFKRRRLLQYHVRAAHTGERPHACATCGATFVYPDHLRKHARAHTQPRPYACEICGKKFNTADCRNTHRFVHSDKKPYECLVCGTGFMRKSLLYTHMTTSGHITESIVVNQPRVSQIGDESDVPVTELVETNNQENTSSQVELENMSTENVFVGAGTGSGNTLYISNGDENNSAFSLTTTDVEKYVANEDGTYVRLVQVQLPGGGEGWIALEEMPE